MGRHQNNDGLVQLLWPIIGLSLVLVGFGPKYDSITDPELVSAIEQRLEMDGRINAERIQVKSKGGHVVLDGVVESVVEKTLAEGLVARSIIGVHSVTNHLAVRPPVMKDDAIKKAVQENLKTTPALYDTSISVSVRDGIVKLEGVVDSLLQRRAARQAVEVIDGVAGVTNLVKVRLFSRPDREIEKEVSLYLLWSPIVNIDRVDFDVENGVVKLKGEVEHLTHVLSLLQDLERMEGVVEVDASGLAITSTRSAGTGG